MLSQASCSVFITTFQYILYSASNTERKIHFQEPFLNFSGYESYNALYISIFQTLKLLFTESNSRSIPATCRAQPEVYALSLRQVDGCPKDCERTHASSRKAIT